MVFRVAGFGFLAFEDDEAVDRCCAEHFVNLNGKQVRTCIEKVYVFPLKNKSRSGHNNCYYFILLLL